MANGNGSNLNHGHHLLRTYWPMFAALLALAATWGGFTTGLAENKKADNRTEQRVDEVEDDLSKIQTSIAVIETRQMATSAELSRIRSSIDALVNELRQARESRGGE